MALVYPIRPDPIRRRLQLTARNRNFENLNEKINFISTLQIPNTWVYVNALRSKYNYLRNTN